ncbi:MAG: D-2-hydroxyacid dehydrogenase [Clostridiales bacterium]|nr:D-2-hydroxyacid dehydrogenase [Clostridiales bacterium]
MNIVILDAYSVNPGDIDWAPIERFGSLKVYDNTPADEVAARLKDADVVFTNRERIGEAEFAAAPNLRFLGLFATGYDKIDLAAARKRGVAVCNVPGYSTDSVAQHAIALLLELTNRTRALDAEVRKGRWTLRPGDCAWDEPIVALSGKTFGVLGTGAIGCAAARIAGALGMRVIGHSRSRRAAFAGTYVSLEELFGQSDVLSLHCAASEETRGIVNRDTLAKMKRSAILINTARGALVESGDLAEALNKGTIYAAGVDVVSSEPIRPDDPLLGAKNCLITPHVAWMPVDVRKRLVEIAAENLNAFLNGTRLNRVDLEG